jgi:serine/threonine protein phosphatase PrpC
LPVHIHAAALSDAGCVRSNNEDSFAMDPERGLYVVCDGMGGRAAGEVASALACGTLLRAYAAQRATQPPAAALPAAIAEANAAVWNAADETGQHGMGTTLVAAAIQDDRLVVGNVGDSRAYLLRDGTCTQVTADHSYVNELIRHGTISADAPLSPEVQRLKSMITRAIGTAAHVQPDIYPLDLRPGDMVVLASDGLTRYLDAPAIAGHIDTADLEASCAGLIDTAKKAGGVDNITTVLLRYDQPADKHEGSAQA